MADAVLAALDQAATSLIDALRVVDEARSQLRTVPIGNLKPAPFYLNSTSVSAILSDRQGPGVVDVPVADVPLVDRPRRSEDPRLAKANDDAAEGPRLLGRAAHVDWNPEVWEAFVAAWRSGHSLSWSRNVCLPLARERGFALPRTEAFRRRLIRLGVTRPAAAPAETDNTSLCPSTSTETAPRTEEGTPAARVDSRSGPVVGSAEREAAAAGESISKRAPVEPVHVAEFVPVEADHLDWPDAPLPANGRTYADERIVGGAETRFRLKPEPEAVDDDEDAPVDFAAALKRVQDRKVGAVKTVKPKPDYARFVAARSAAKPVEAVKPKRPLRPAESPEECKRCGVPGFKGCEHQLPYGAEA